MLVAGCWPLVAGNASHGRKPKPLPWPKVDRNRVKDEIVSKSVVTKCRGNMNSGKGSIRTVQFVRYLTSVNRWRRLHYAEHGRIVYFSVQYEAFIEGKWRPIIRYDTAHGFAHRDIMHPDGTQEKIFIASKDYGQALKAAELDIKNNWPHYRKTYEEEMQKYASRRSHEQKS
jgi:hypothetical protein